MFTIVFGIAFIATALAGSWWTFFYLALFILSANEFGNQL